MFWFCFVPGENNLQGFSLALIGPLGYTQLFVNIT